MDAALRWLIAFAWTLAVELPVYQLWLGRGARKKWHPVATGLAANIATHPLFGAWVLLAAPSGQAIALAEAAIVLVEAALLRLLPWCRARWLLAFGAALSANLMSYLVGLLVAPR